MEFEYVHADLLANYLRRFYAEARQRNGEVYSKSGYANIRSAIQCHITSAPYNRTINILQDPAFKQANNMYKGKLKEIKKSGKDITKHKSPLSEEDMSKLRLHLKSHMNTPKGLQEKVMFDVLYFFGRRGREGLRELKQDSFEFVEDGEGNEYANLPFNEFDKNHCDVTDTESNETDKRIYSQNGDDCPVASLKKYISHLNVDHESFFQRPNPVSLLPQVAGMTVCR